MSGYRWIIMNTSKTRQHAVIVAAGLCLLSTLGPTGAQTPHPIDHQQPISETVRAAYAAPYGRAMIVDFAAIIRDSAQPGCLQTKGLDDSKLLDRSRQALERFAIQFLEIWRKAIDMRAYDAALAAVGGADAAGVLAQLRTDHDVQQLMKLEIAATLSIIPATMAENMTKYAILYRWRLARPLWSFDETASKQRVAGPYEVDEAAVQRFILESRSAQVVRYVALDRRQRAIRL